MSFLGGGGLLSRSMHQIYNELCLNSTGSASWGCIQEEWDLRHNHPTPNNQVCSYHVTVFSFNMMNKIWFPCAISFTFAFLCSIATFRHSCALLKQQNVPHSCVVLQQQKVSPFLCTIATTKIFAIPL